MMDRSLLLITVQDPGDKERAVKNGGVIFGAYRQGWMVEVEAVRVGEISYRLADGSVIRNCRCPAAITYRRVGVLPGRRPLVEWHGPRVSGDTEWLGVIGRVRGGDGGAGGAEQASTTRRRDGFHDEDHAGGSGGQPDVK